ncbi:RDD family protein [Arthrobacter sp. NamB2]|uniref:RDD family protein n=1 Tax=Arthrobacter sp. NamB2 TaxID=2576035 RepID=UPI001671E0CC|nr:RDD family protein [Arthrobacter sp. NamB2]
MAQLELRDAAAIKRLVAKLVDVLPAGLLGGVLTAVGLNTIETQQVSAVSQQVDLTGFLVFQGISSLASLAYFVAIWGWEARTGRTPGNLLLGLRTTNEEGHPAGWLAIFVRGLLVAVAGVIPVIGTVLMLVSNVFDPNGKRQGWHDKAAHTRVFDVRAGRNPIETGGIGGPASFAPPEPAPGLQPVVSPMPTPGGVSLQQGRSDPRVGRDTELPAAVARPTLAPERHRDPVPVAPAVLTFAPPAPTAGNAATAQFAASPAPAPIDHPDDAMGETRVSAGHASGPLKILFDNGREVELRSHALIGRNPAGQNGEMIDQLIDFSDQGRSVSKTHLHVRVEGQGLWVTDRNSTNGSAITAPDGQRTPVRAGETLLAQPGSTVHFGDRSFLVVRP